MSSYLTGTATFQSEVTEIGEFGFWILVGTSEGTKEYFVPFDDYPGFKNATVSQIYAMEQSSPDQLHWPELDEDIEIEALERPERFPLQFKR